MIIGDSKKQVIENIKNAVAEKQYNSKVEVGDPMLDDERRDALLNKYIKTRNSIPYYYRNLFARIMVNVVTAGANYKTIVDGLDNLKGIKGGAIITSNHFNPIDTTIVRYSMRRAGRRRMFIVSQESNLAMTGFIGFFMKYADIIPISKKRDYMEKYFYRTLSNLLTKKKECILIYPEQEMWFNYRKPRPPKRGAYFYAAKFNVPIVSCFVEMIDEKLKDTEEFNKVSYVMHILPPIYPDPDVNPRDDSVRMMKQDYDQKVAAYEKAYGKKLDYEFEDWDVAGYRGEEI